MTAPRQMTQYTLNALKGWPAPNALDFVALFDSSVTLPVLAGTVLTLNSAGNYILGTGTLNTMPLFLFQDSDDPDVSNDGGNASTTAGVFVPVFPTGEAMTLVATGGYELASTAYDTTASFTIGNFLYAPTAGATAGLLTNCTVYAKTVCGQVSRGIVDNGYGYNAVAFWPLFIPKNAAGG